MPDQEAESKASSLLLRTSHDRLSIYLPHRLWLSLFIGASSGFLIGSIKGSQDNGLRFRAENAHRLPTSQTGWYLYHKSKNYNMALGGIVEGLKQARMFAFWTGLFFVLEEGVDRGRALAAREWRERRQERPVPVDEERAILSKQRDALSSALAGTGTAGFFSIWNNLPSPTTSRTMKLGATAGFGFGLLQDALSLLAGRRLGYVDLIGNSLFQRHDSKET